MTIRADRRVSDAASVVSGPDHATAEEFGRPSDLTRADVARLADEIFGMTVSRVQRLPSERDRNFHLTEVGGRQFVLKVAKVDPCVFDFQTQVLLHAERRDPKLPLPRVVPPVKSGPETVAQILRDPDCRIRCVTYLRGRPLATTDGTPTIWRRLGSVTARLNNALADFRHPGADHRLLWDLKRADQVRDLVASVTDQRKRTLIDRLLGRFTEELQPRLTTFRAQVIHNDLNPHNILELGHGRLGIVDFGDCIRAPLVQELATAGSYQITTVGHPLESFAQFLAAYRSVLPLLPEEVAILPDLILVRLALWVTITSWRALHEPDNAHYVLRNERTVDTSLRRLLQLPEEKRSSWLQKRLAGLGAEA